MRLLLLLAVAILLPAAPQKQETTVLGIEAGVHTNIVWDVAVDPGGRYMVTCSEDKTARVWELPSLRLLQAFRPPTGKSRGEGQLFAIALAPDGKTAAVGGWTGMELGDSSNIYFFDIKTGRMVHRIGGFEGTIQSLAFARDGRLAAGVDDGSLHVFSSEGKPAFEADDFDSIVRGLSFDASGRLVVCSTGGLVRLYDPSGKVLAETKRPEVMRPLRVTFSPDGSQIAIGDDRLASIAVLDGNTLEWKIVPNMKGVDAPLQSVAWSADGTTLYAGGRAADDQGRHFIRRWSRRGQGDPVDIPVAGDSVLALASLPTGGVAFGAGDCMGTVGEDGGVARYVSAAPDLRDVFKTMRVTDDGDEVRFGYRLGGEDPASFSVSKRTLNPSPPANPEDSPGHPSYNITPTIEVTYWYRNSHPKLNGADLDLGGEKSLCMGLLHDASGFVMGTSATLRRYDKEGNLKWSLPAPGSVYAVDPTKDGRLVVAAYSDGTLRWHRLSDGKELLALFAHADKKGWVLWTPEGHYDISSGGEGLLGWVTSHGLDAEAEYLPAGTKPEEGYRPDVIARILTTLDEAEAVRQADGVK